jgi:hypothetical protein
MGCAAGPDAGIGRITAAAQDAESSTVLPGYMVIGM